MKSDLHRQSVYVLVLSVGVLIVLGLVMLFSTSAFARDAHGHDDFFIKRQAMWLGIGFVLCIVAARVDYHFWQKTWYIWFAVALVLLALCYVPHIGLRINGSRRWIKLGSFTFQPSEIGKIAAIVTLAWWFARDEKLAGEFLRGFVFPVILMGLI